MILLSSWLRVSKSDWVFPFPRFRSEQPGYPQKGPRDSFSGRFPTFSGTLYQVNIHLYLPCLLDGVCVRNYAHVSPSNLHTEPIEITAPPYTILQAESHLLI